MKGFAAAFWMALAAVCQAFSSFALQRSIWWSTKASRFYERSASSVARRGTGRAGR